MEFKKGQIFFWRSSNTFFSLVIKLYNYKKFNDADLPTHVGIITKVEKTRVQIHEATNKGFVKSWYDIKWLNGRIKADVVSIGECKEKLTYVEQNADKYLGIGYGWLDIITIGLSLLTKFKFGLTGKNKIICSEAVNYVIYDSTKKINIAAEYGISTDSVTPAHIYLSTSVRIL